MERSRSNKNKLCKKCNDYDANAVHLSETLENTALVRWIRCEPLGEHLIYQTSVVFSNIALKMNKVCISSHDQVRHEIAAIH